MKEGKMESIDPKTLTIGRLIQLALNLSISSSLSRTGPIIDVIYFKAGCHCLGKDGNITEKENLYVPAELSKSMSKSGNHHRNCSQRPLTCMQPSRSNFWTISLDQHGVAPEEDDGYRICLGGCPPHEPQLRVVAADLSLPILSVRHCNIDSLLLWSKIFMD